MEPNVRTLYRRALGVLIDSWRSEGDDAPRRELLRDAKLHIRWRQERGASLPDAAAATVKTFAPAMREG